MQNNDSVYQSTTVPYIPSIDPNGKLTVEYDKNYKDKFKINQNLNTVPQISTESEPDSDDQGVGIDLLIRTIRGKSVPHGRNEICGCGSNKKYKRCCGDSRIYINTGNPISV